MIQDPIIEISAFQLMQHNPAVIIFDARTGKEAYAQYLEEHIAGAHFVDLNQQLAAVPEDYAKGGRHPLPMIKEFEKTLQSFGLTKAHHIIVYDDKNGANAAARFWWMMKSVGHQKVQVLNGGLAFAKANGVIMGKGNEENRRSTKPYSVEQWSLPIAELNDVFHQMANGIIIDVREKLRFEGVQEPIDLIAGHIPGAINIPFSENLDERGFFLPSDVLHAKYTRLLGASDMNEVIVHCGSGVTACHTLLAMERAQLQSPKLYVGSWSEWSRNNMPIVGMRG